MSCFQDFATLTQNSPKSQHWVACQGVVNQPCEPSRSGDGHRFRCSRLHRIRRHFRSCYCLCLFKCLRKVARIHDQEALAGNQKHFGSASRYSNPGLARLESLASIGTERVSLFAVNHRVDAGNLVLRLDSEADGLLDEKTDDEREHEAVDQNRNRA